MLKVSLLAVLAVALIVAPQEPAEKKADDSLKGVKCCMMPKADVKAAQSVDYKEGKVYFCCAKCKGTFEKDPAKYAVKANQQLVASKQYEQKACPISGQPADDAQTVKVGGVEVHFCCGDCVKKVDSAADEDAKAKLVFSDEAFEKAFAKAKAEEEKKEKKGSTN